MSEAGVIHEFGDILDEAKKIITGARNIMYGKPENSFEVIAKYWSIYLQHKYAKPDSFVGYLSTQDVAIMMALLKMARLTTGFSMRDSYVDCAGYLAIAASIGQLTKEDLAELGTERGNHNDKA